MIKKSMRPKMIASTVPRARRRTSHTQPRLEVVPPRSENSTGQWTFLTNHAHVLILLALNPSIVIRKVAEMVGITERAVQKIIADLEEEKYLEREKVGRQNRYRINRDRKLRHAVEAHRSIGDFLRMIDPPAAT